MWTAGMNEIPRVRCAWAGAGLMREYHDREWGKPDFSDRRLFEFIVLEGAQAGLSWSTILNKRDGYREAFDGFDPVLVASYGEEKIQELLQNPAIVRNRLKINAAVQNARAVVSLQTMGSFSNYIWSFVDGKPIQNQFENLAEIPAETVISRAMSKDLIKRGFHFVGPTICYAFMQAIGMVNDHTIDCFRHLELSFGERSLGESQQ
jgi:DNA-3-methyladenine glycosylase I